MAWWHHWADTRAVKVTAGQTEQTVMDKNKNKLQCCVHILIRGVMVESGVRGLDKHEQTQRALFVKEKDWEVEYTVCMSVRGTTGVNMMLIENFLKVWYSWSFFSEYHLWICGYPLSNIYLSIYNILNPTWSHAYSLYFTARAEVLFVTKIMPGETFRIVSSRRGSAFRFSQQNYLFMVGKRLRMTLQKHAALSATNTTTNVVVCRSPTLLSWVKV